MFWENSKDKRDTLNWRDNIEWIDWRGTASTGRRLDWSEHPTKVSPPLCVNSGAVQVAVTARAQLIGHELKNQVADLRRTGKEHLYAGVIAGWESMIGADFATGKHTGCHALTNKGFSLYPEGNTLEVIRDHLKKHGAVTANIYSWGIGGNAERERNIFRRATENAEALSAYRKFLKGESLVEAPKTSAASSSEQLREKIDRIQRRLPAWVSGKPERMQTAKSMMERLEGALKSNNFQQADASAEEVLKVLTK